MTTNFSHNGPVPTTLQPATASEAPLFAALGLEPRLVRAVGAEHYSVPTPVQAQVIPHVLAGRDVLAAAQTGTGKTAAFLLPILQRLATQPGDGSIRALVLTPTRELAAQIGERAGAYGRYLGLRHTVIYCGVGEPPQIAALRGRPDLLIATPGRLLDLMSQGHVRLGGVTHFVLDEADRMLDMGFVHDVRRVVKTLPTRRQTLLFSATIPAAIIELSREVVRDAVRVAVTPEVTTADTVEQSVMFVPSSRKREFLEKVLADPTVERALVFARTKHGANRLTQYLERAGIGALAIHGNKSQGARERALEGFRRGTTRVLVATDVAARGIDVEGISHVINYDVPNVPESYVHRIGRTGRAGATGRAISFCDHHERGWLADIEKLIRRRLPVAHDELLPPAPAATPTARPARPGGNRFRNRGRRGGN